jgi:hypothetical protein
MKRVLLVAEIEDLPADAAPGLVTRRLDAFREAGQPSQNHGITLYQATDEDIEAVRRALALDQPHLYWARVYAKGSDNELAPLGRYEAEPARSEDELRQKAYDDFWDDRLSDCTMVLTVTQHLDGEEVLDYYVDKLDTAAQERGLEPEDLDELIYETAMEMNIDVLNQIASRDGQETFIEDVEAAASRINNEGLDAQVRLLLVHLTPCDPPAYSTGFQLVLDELDKIEPEDD